jgi:chromosome segregation ATPase
LNQQLNESNQELDRLNGKLEQRVEDFAEQNQILNATAQRLNIQVDSLEESVLELSRQSSILQNRTQSLQNETEKLSDTNQQLNVTVEALRHEIDRKVLENNRLTDLNQDLTVIVAFLNDTAININESFEAITTFLAEKITAHRVLVLEILHNTYIQRVANWGCDYRDTFRGKPFVTDTTHTPIGKESYPKVIEYVDERLLSELCFNVTAFEQYLSRVVVQSGAIPPVSVTTDQLITGAQRYTTAALNSYFPAVGKNGVTPEDWAAADYSCDNLSATSDFRLSEFHFLRKRDITTLHI